MNRLEELSEEVKKNINDHDVSKTKKKKLSFDEDYENQQKNQKKFQVELSQDEIKRNVINKAKKEVDKERECLYVVPSIRYMARQIKLEREKNNKKSTLSNVYEDAIKLLHEKEIFYKDKKTKYEN